MLMTVHKHSRKNPKEHSAFASFFKWSGLILTAASFWALIITDSIGESRLSLIAAAISLTAIIFLRLCYFANLARINRSGSNALIDELDGVEFEHFCASVLKKNGFCDVKVTKSSGDFGADITAADHIGNIWVFQCKRYASNIGNTPIQEVSAARQHYNAQCAVVMTNRHFTSAARQLAEENEVLLIEREKLFRMNKNPKKDNCRKLTKHFSSSSPSKQNGKTGGIIILDDHLDD